MSSLLALETYSREFRCPKRITQVIIIVRRETEKILIFIVTRYFRFLKWLSAENFP